MSLFQRLIKANKSKSLEELIQDPMPDNDQEQFDLAEKILKSSTIPHSKAIPFLLQSARRNNIDAIFALGYCYGTGDGIERNLENAESTLSKAMDLGADKGLVYNMLAHFYGSDTSTAESLQKAADFCVKADEFGEPCENQLCIPLYKIILESNFDAINAILDNSVSNDGGLFVVYEELERIKSYLDKLIQCIKQEIAAGENKDNLPTPSEIKEYGDRYLQLCAKANEMYDRFHPSQFLSQ